MAVDIEAIACRELRAMLAGVEVGAPIAESDELRAYLDSLEHMLPDIFLETYLDEEHPWWRWVDCDGILSSVARKSDSLEAEVLGLYYLMDKWGRAPIYVRMRVAPDADEIESLECKLGECGDGPGGVECGYTKSLAKRLHLLPRQAPDIDWAYTVTVSSRTAL